jgi:hypothetical protein
MRAQSKVALCLILLVAGAVAQQPNSGYATMAINGVFGPPYPNYVNLRTSLPAYFNFAGATNQPYVLFQTSAIQVGSYFLPASNSLNSVDLTLNPFPVIVIDGFQYPAYSTNSSGNAFLQIDVPPAGNPPLGVPLGLQLALQALLADPFSSIGVTFTAATQITVTQGPTITTLGLGDEGNATVNVALNPIPFYGTNRLTLTVNANGYLTFTASSSDFTPSASEFNSQQPRMAGFWTDLDSMPSTGGTIKSIVDNNPGPGLVPYVRIDYEDVHSWLAGQTHTFSMYMQTDGYLEIIHATTNNASLYDTITGIGPGGNLSSAPQKNFVGGVIPGAPVTIGDGILSNPPYSFTGANNESFFEWWGIVSQHLYYGNGYDNPYDMYATTLHFLPAGTGGLPGSTIKYTLY